eukprot:jgi/Galph1/3816/GphlegSOOS_G2475.1
MFLLAGHKLVLYRENRKHISSLKSSALDRNCKKVFVFGLGYVAKPIALQLAQKGWHVVGTRRTLSNKDEVLRKSGVTCLHFHTEQCSQLEDDILENLYQSTHLLICLPAIQGGDPLCCKFFSTLKSLVQKSSTLEWIGYLSSTVVYEPPADDSWITEDSPLASSSKKANSYTLAEEQWKSLWLGNHRVHLFIFRLSALYGPGRSALDTLLRLHVQGVDWDTFLSSEKFHGEVIVSRIHQLDACEKIQTAMTVLSNYRKQAKPYSVGRNLVINLADDCPSSRAECYYFARKLASTELLECWIAKNEKTENDVLC